MTKKEFDQLAHEIAESTVQSDIESFCRIEIWSGKHFGRWFDSSSASEGLDTECVARAVRYLEHNGKLVRNPENLHLVRFQSPEVLA